MYDEPERGEAEGELVERLKLGSKEEGGLAEHKSWVRGQTSDCRARRGRRSAASFSDAQLIHRVTEPALGETKAAARASSLRAVRAVRAADGRTTLDDVRPPRSRSTPWTVRAKDTRFHDGCDTGTEGGYESMWGGRARWGRSWGGGRELDAIEEDAYFCVAGPRSAAWYSRSRSRLRWRRTIVALPMPGQ